MFYSMHWAIPRRSIYWRLHGFYWDSQLSLRMIYINISTLIFDHYNIWIFQTWDFISYSNVQYIGKLIGKVQKNGPKAWHWGKKINLPWRHFFLSYPQHQWFSFQVSWPFCHTLASLFSTWPLITYSTTKSFAIIFIKKNCLGPFFCTCPYAISALHTSATVTGIWVAQSRSWQYRPVTPRK